MNYSTSNTIENNGLIITVKRNRKTFNILISKEVPFLTKDYFEEINRIITIINEESLLGSFYFGDGKLTFQMLSFDKLNEKSLKMKLNTSIAAFESILNMLEVIIYGKR